MCSEGPKDFEDGSGGQSPVEKDVYKLYPSWVLLSKDLIAVDPCAGDGPDDEQLQETVTSSSVKKGNQWFYKEPMSFKVFFFFTVPSTSSKSIFINRIILNQTYSSVWTVRRFLKNK